jgi:hypothetical protein
MELVTQLPVRMKVRTRVACQRLCRSILLGIPVRGHLRPVEPDGRECCTNSIGLRRSENILGHSVDQSAGGKESLRVRFYM